jgi:hypothetical protein
MTTTTTIPVAGDPFSSRRAPSTRHHRVDEAFLELLEEDFGISTFTLSNAFMGFPAEPKKLAIAIAGWAAEQDQPERALLAWARKHGRGTFRPDVADEDH